jgi:Lon protease-like protein
MTDPGAAGAPRTMPMFPLGAVLFPYGYLPLHVFEPRYRQLTKDVLAGDREFGVVLIERGSEVGGGDARTMVGTVASVAQAVEADDGRWALAAIGVRRLRVERWLDDDPYPRAEVVDHPEGAWSPAADARLASCDRAVRRSLGLLAELGEPAAPVHVELAPDPSAAAWQLAAISPLGPFDRQRLLLLDDPAERLGLLEELVEEECTVLAHRLAGG